MLWPALISLYPSRSTIGGSTSYPQPRLLTRAGEAIVFADGQRAELDGAYGLASGMLALVEKKKGK